MSFRIYPLEGQANAMDEGNSDDHEGRHKRLDSSPHSGALRLGLEQTENNVLYKAEYDSTSLLCQVRADLDFQVSLVGEGLNAAVRERTLELRVVECASIRVARLPLVLYFGSLGR